MLNLVGFLIGAMHGQYQYIQSDNEIFCLTVNIYQEARGDGIASQVGVANNVMQRVKSSFYPNSICGVVHQVTAKSCAYSWWCDSKSDVIDLSNPINSKAFIQASIVADAFVNAEEEFVLPGFDGALLYHSVWIEPRWVNSNLTKYVGAIGSHKYYLESRNKPIAL